MATQAGLITADEISALAAAYAQRRSSDKPHPDKGALWATQPGDHTKGDILKFRFYPSTLPIELSRNVAAETIAGRAMPAFQDLGGGGVKFTVELLFSDAWLTYSESTPLRAGTPLETTARHAKTWFDMYIAGHDGGGISIPLVYTYFQLGHSNPVRVIIHSAKLITEFFDKNDNPMQVNATVEMSVFEPVEFVSPFKPKVKPKSTGRSKPKPETNQCPEPAQPACVCPGSDAQESSSESSEARASKPGGIVAFGAFQYGISDVVARAKAGDRVTTTGVTPAVGDSAMTLSRKSKETATIRAFRERQAARARESEAKAHAPTGASVLGAVADQADAAIAKAAATVQANQAKAEAAAHAAKQARDARDYQRYQELLSRTNGRR